VAKASEVVQQGVQSIQTKLKEIKQADEEDLGKIAQSFDDLSAQADELADVLFRADQALSGQNGNGDDQDEENGEEQAEEEEEPEAEPEPEPQQRKRGKRQNAEAEAA